MSFYINQAVIKIKATPGGLEPALTSIFNHEQFKAHSLKPSLRLRRQSLPNTSSLTTAAAKSKGYYVIDQENYLYFAMVQKSYASRLGASPISRCVLCPDRCAHAFPPSPSITTERRPAAFEMIETMMKFRTTSSIKFNASKRCSPSYRDKLMGLEKKYRMSDPSSKSDKLLELKSSLQQSRQNVGKACHAALSHLEEALAVEQVVEQANDQAEQLGEVAVEAKKHFACQNMKMTIYLIVTIVCVIFIAVAVIGGGVAIYLKPWELIPKEPAAPAAAAAVAPAPAGTAPAGTAPAPAPVAAAAPAARRLLQLLMKQRQ